MLTFLRAEWKIVAAITAGVVVVAAVAAIRGDAVEDRFERAAATLEATTALFDLSGDGEITFELPQLRQEALPGIEIPPLAFPDADLSQIPAPLREKLAASLDDANRRLEGARGDLADQLATGLADAIPSEISTVFGITGEGELALPDRLHVSGVIEPTTSTSDNHERVETHPFEATVIGDDTWIRQPDGTWVSVPGPGGPFSPLVLDPQTAARFLRYPGDAIVEVGDETIDGVETTHYRFSVDATRVNVRTSGSASWRADVWIGPDDEVRRFAITADGALSGAEVSSDLFQGTPSTTWNYSIQADYHSFGTPVDIHPPAEVSDEVSVPDGSSAIVYPFGAHIHIS